MFNLFNKSKKEQQKSSIADTGTFGVQHSGIITPAQTNNFQNVNSSNPNFASPVNSQNQNKPASANVNPNPNRNDIFKITPPNNFKPKGAVANVSAPVRQQTSGNQQIPQKTFSPVQEQTQSQNPLNKTDKILNHNSLVINVADGSSEDLGVQSNTINQSGVSVDKKNTDAPILTKMPDEKEFNKGKASAVSMLDAIEQKAGKEKRQEWEAELKSHNKLIHNENNLKERKMADTSPADAIKNKPKPIGTVRTLRRDMQDMMLNEKLSLAKMVAIESDRRRNTKDLKRRAAKNKYSMLTVAVLFVAILMTASVFMYAFYIANHDTTVSGEAVVNQNTVKTSLINNLIFIENRIRIDVSNKPNFYILSILAAARESSKISSILGNIIEFELVKKNGSGYARLPIANLIKILNPERTETFASSLSNEEYMLGVHMASDGRHPFVIFRTHSFKYALTGMLNWEKTLVDDVGRFMIPGYRYDSIKPDNADKFEDAVLKNYSIRITKYKNGKIKLMYGFIGQDVIVITNSPKTFLEIARRVNIEHRR